MKILITTDLYTVTTNGVVTSVKNLLSELEQKGHDVKVLTFSDNCHSRQEGNIYYIRSMPFAVYPDVRMPLAIRHRFLKEIIEWKPEVIHSQCEFFSFQYASYISKKTKAPIVHTYHTLYEQYVTYVLPSQKLGERIVKRFSKSRLKKVKCVIAPTHKVENTLRGYGMENNMAVVPSGISLKQHLEPISADERLSNRRELGIGDDKVVMINLGRLGTEKNLEELMAFFAKAVKENDKLVFLIVGDGPAKPLLEKQAKELGVSEYVIFTGMVKPAEVQNYYKLGDVFVSASTSETQGLTYVEAAANGLPLLCRNDLCLEDVLIQGKNGYAYNDEKEFLEGIKFVAENEEWRKEAGTLSREIATPFDKTEFGNAVEKIYNEVTE